MSRLADIASPILLLLLGAGLYLFELGVPAVIDPVESRFAEISRQMFVDREALLPRLDGEAVPAIPLLPSWGQILGYRLFGISPHGARFVNALCGIATVLLIYLGTRAPLGGRTALRASLILGSSLLFAALARIATPALPLTMFLTLALLALWAGVERALRDQGGIFWFGAAGLAAGAAMLCAGPVGAVVVLAIGICYPLSIGRPALLFRKNRLLAAGLLMVAAGSSWYLALGFTHPEGFGLAKQIWLDHHTAAIARARQGYSGVVSATLAVLLIGFVPWFGYLPIAAWRMPRWHGTSGPERRLPRLFAINSALVILVLPLSAAGLPASLLPALPGLALVTATLFEHDVIRHPLAWRAAGWLSAALVLLLAFSLAAAPLIAPYLPELLGESSRTAPFDGGAAGFGLTPWLAAGLLLGCALIISRATRTQRIATIFEALLATSITVSVVLLLLILPVYDRLIDRPLVALAAQAGSLTPPHGRIVMFQLDNRPSVNFAAGRRTVFHGESDFRKLPSRFAEPDIAVGITTSRCFDRLGHRGIPVSEINRDSGFVLFRLRAGAAPSALPRHDGGEQVSP